MHLPEPIYKALPYIYIVCGIVTFIKIDHPIAILSGGLFVVAGTLVFHWRS